MAKPMDSGHSKDDIVRFVRWKTDPNTLLKLRALSETDKNDLLSSRIHYNVETKKNPIPTDQILILSSSKNSIFDIDLHLTTKFKKYHDIQKFTFKELINHLLGEKFKTWKILDEYEVNRINRLMDEECTQFSLEYTKLKDLICFIGVVTPNTIKSMNEDELLVRFGMYREDALKLKKIVGNDFYVTYAQLIEEAKKIPDLVSQLNKFKYIFVSNFHNLMKGETEFLSQIAIGKHLTIVAANDTTPAKPKLFEMNWNNITCNYSDKKLLEVHLKDKSANVSSNTVNSSSSGAKSAEYQPNITKTSNAFVKQESPSELLDQILQHKMCLTNIEELVDVVMNVLANKRSDLPFLKLMSLIPGFDDTFLKTFCKLVTTENNCIFDFLIKYHDSLSDKTKTKILPVLKYLSTADSKLDKTSVNSVMSHIVNIFKAIGIDTQATENMKEQFHQLNLWLKFLETHKEFKISDDLIECYIKNGSFKSEFGSTKFNHIEENPLNATIKIKLPVSISMEKTHNQISVTPIKRHTEDIPLKRSGAIKYTPRPRSWHAGNLFNAARKLR